MWNAGIQLCFIYWVIVYVRMFVCMYRGYLFLFKCSASEISCMGKIREMI